MKTFKFHFNIISLHRNWLTVFIVTVCFFTADAQKKKGGFLNNDDKPHDASMFTPMIFPGYSPELGFSIGGGALWSFKTKKGDTTLLRSSVPFGITYGFKGAISLKANWAVFWLNNRLRVYSDWNYRNMNDHYFGVGYESGSSLPQGDSTKYLKDWFQFDSRVVWELDHDFFVGLRLDLNQTIAKNPNLHMQNDPYYLEYGPKNYNSGWGPVIQYDSRDFPQNAFSGSYMSLYITAYSGFLGGQNLYTNMDLDVRKFFELSESKRRILAAWLRLKIAGGNVPYNEVNQIGPTDLRGYFWGQYRDKVLSYAMVEYRHTFHKPDGKPRKYGFVVWGASASITSEFGNVSLTNVLPNTGVGFRYELQPRLNARFDYGHGFNSNLFYIGFSEQF